MHLEWELWDMYIEYLEIIGFETAESASDLYTSR
jgi:hypothetical protein